MGQKTVIDLGELTDDVLLFGGAVSNLHASNALMDLADAAGIPVANRLSTGDAPGYCADPAATWDLLAARAGPAIAGNVERQLAAGSADCGCGFGAGSTCDLLSRGWYAHAERHTRPDMRSAFAALPDHLTFTHQTRRYALLHGGATDIARFLWPVTPEAELAAEIAAMESLCGPLDGIIAGHSGLPFLRRIGRRLWINPGAVGLPPNDGDPATAYALLTAAGPALKRLAYDHAAAAAAMWAAGLTQGYDRALVTGHWPSEDILPPPLRRAA